jgi:AICAR transformylase/IMP cyclohydrolase PurH
LSIVSSIQQIPLFRSESYLRQKYEVEKLSTKEIAAEIFSSRTAVSGWLKAYGIPIRTSYKTASHLRYGEALRRRKVVIHRREQQYIEKMNQLRAQGFSYWKIADVLNSMKIPTKTGRGCWHARSVQQILDAALKSTSEGLHIPCQSAQ